MRGDSAIIRLLLSSKGSTRGCRLLFRLADTVAMALIASVTEIASLAGWEVRYDNLTT